jgi:hypothetical protein
MRGAIPPLPQYAFKAWYSVKAQGQFYLHLIAVSGAAVFLNGCPLVRFTYSALAVLHQDTYLSHDGTQRSVNFFDHSCSVVHWPRVLIEKTEQKWEERLHLESGAP